MGLVLLLAGKQVFEILLFPMAFLFLMVPLPQSLVNIIAFPLQLIAAGWAVSSLQAFGIPSLLEGNIIHLAHTQLFVAEACSGLRSLMALLTLGVVFAQFFRAGRLFQQSILVLSAIPIAIVVNAVRVSLTGILTHNFGPEAAGGFIHDFQGIITFSMAFIMLLGEAQLLTVAANLIKRSRAQEASPA
jgi:exosortase